ncbi:amidase domain-containing protein [Desulfosporosinus sp. SB140]|uniref:amidase domain-containing protein n=1 Tax=Desulfosporosinus paludis TaxID=3115649 RepID=UPI003891107B
MVKNLISMYFDKYFESFQTLQIADLSNIVEDNDQTFLYNNILQSQVEANRAINLSYTKYNVNLDFKNILFSGNKATVNALMSCDYAYSTTPDQKSAMYNIEYNFELSKINSQWKITSIDSNFNEYDYFKNQVGEKQKKGLSKRQAITETKKERSDNIKITIDYLKGNPLIKPNNEKQNKTTFSTMSVSVSYNKWLAVNWAQRFATAPNESRFFYTAGTNDCTNFVSQCVWAGYGGYVEGNDTQTKTNISNKFRMINVYPSGWYGGAIGGGGTPAWESVVSLWNYATPVHSSGPNATGYNNNQPYYNYLPNQIYLGEVLQFRNGSTGDYTHSVIVTYSKDSNNSYYSDILVSQHSDNLWNRNLWELIQNKGGNSCYMRDMTFKSASFAS